MNQKKRPKGAILLFGITRGKASICYPAFKKLVLDELQNAGFDYDVYLHAFELEVVNATRSKEHAISIENPQDWKLFEPDVYASDNQKIFDSQTDYEKRIAGKELAPSYDPSTAVNLLRQLHSLKKVYSLVSDKSYDFYLLSRLDLEYAKTDDLIQAVQSLVASTDDGILYTPRWHQWDGLNDRLALADKSAAEAYCNRIDFFDELTAEKIHSEELLHKLALKRKLRMEFLDVFAFRLRANGKHDKLDQEHYDIKYGRKLFSVTSILRRIGRSKLPHWAWPFADQEIRNLRKHTVKLLKKTK